MQDQIWSPHNALHMMCMHHKLGSYGGYVNEENVTLIHVLLFIIMAMLILLQITRVFKVEKRMVPVAVAKRRVSN